MELVAIIIMCVFLQFGTKTSLVMADVPIAFRNLQEEYQTLRDDSNYKSAFHVTTSHTMNMPITAGSVVVLPVVVTKVGDDYDESTGVFSPHRAGLYSFHLTVASERTVRFYFMVNNVNINQIYTGHSGPWSPITMSFVHQLQAGDRVKVVTSDYTALNCCGRTRFSGYLVSLL